MHVSSLLRARRANVFYCPHGQRHETSKTLPRPPADPSGACPATWRRTPGAGATEADGSGVQGEKCTKGELGAVGVCSVAHRTEGPGIVILPDTGSEDSVQWTLRTPVKGFESR